MVNLKKNTLKRRVDWIKNDLKRTVFLISLPFLSLLLFPNLLPFLSPSLSPTNFSLQTTFFVSIFAIVFCLVFQIYSKLKPEYEQNIKASILFSVYYFFVSAFSEELFFRGFLFSLLLKLTNSPLSAIFVSSLIFGYYHIPMFKWSFSKSLIPFLGGLFFGGVYFLTESLFIVWIAHGLGGLALFHESVVGYFVWTKLRRREVK